MFSTRETHVQHGSPACKCQHDGHAFVLKTASLVGLHPQGLRACSERDLRLIAQGEEVWKGGVTVRTVGWHMHLRAYTAGCGSKGSLGGFLSADNEESVQTRPAGVPSRLSQGADWYVRVCALVSVQGREIVYTVCP